MNGIDFIADTNFVIYLLEGKEEVKVFEEYSYAISFITEIELLGNLNISKEEKLIIKELLKNCVIFDLNDSIKDITIDLKQYNKIKIPDAIIAATSLYLNIPLITADKYFGKINGLNAVILEIS
ncbi:type II toxin-antitoxin system VapC family toxin [Lacihabitans sp. CCS-44]|uniref:type II toxin-antitoxin system VapC family toxin n=1 Tax=Lacihabitans sp. CCS-44 TaxID=2487331 RepID=UPI0020CD6936|nr:type II toxin-antitoxin system VapC family toxin [Lacihabitans sp. CCS-44]MCP9754443.1 type II toxin-antitoxin system VapC family toxin [Lacihabitans sp. CCS-44]